ncbi:hypothetical protein WICPIJ_003862 [Wickerhamomyces pijperi]|uniref:Ornithine decarboxylase antizyme n=1 Tax=Wickerhamomyces pijperi TaxID=599730 RepID=A0A9P8Q969_WICPI|nr:hypothetical protein WICPIJ_003862 [Wickerhamomyces pijperi]
MKNPHIHKYRTIVEVSLDIITLSERQLIIENDFKEDPGTRARGLNNNFKNKNLRYVAFYSNFFKYPIYGILYKDFVFKVFISQEFRIVNDSYNLKNLLMTVMEFTDEIIREDIDADNDEEGKELQLVLYLKRSIFETESQLLLKNINWLGGTLVHNDEQDINKYNDWFIVKFDL